jgi:hypothetical protein
MRTYKFTSIIPELKYGSIKNRIVGVNYDN